MAGAQASSTDFGFHMIHHRGRSTHGQAVGVALFLAGEGGETALWWLGECGEHVQAAQAGEPGEHDPIARAAPEVELARGPQQPESRDPCRDLVGDAGSGDEPVRGEQINGADGEQCVARSVVADPHDAEAVGERYHVPCGPEAKGSRDLPNGRTIQQRRPETEQRRQKDMRRPQGGGAEAGQTQEQCQYVQALQ
jgi:hypothetical protein